MHAAHKDAEAAVDYLLSIRSDVNKKNRVGGQGNEWSVNGRRSLF
jgi:ankyrin repeat protein